MCVVAVAGNDADGPKCPACRSQGPHRAVSEGQQCGRCSWLFHVVGGVAVDRFPMWRSSGRSGRKPRRLSATGR